jgi:hypothetical protein
MRLLLKVGGENEKTASRAVWWVNFADATYRDPGDARFELVLCRSEVGCRKAGVQEIDYLPSNRAALNPL